MSNHRTRGCSSVGRALRSHRRGRGFDYHQLHEEPFCIPPQEGFSLPCEVMAGFWGNRRSYGLSRLRPKVCPTTASTSGLPIPYLLPTLNGIPASAEAGTEEQSRRLMIDVLDALTITRLLRQGDLHDAIMRRNLNFSWNPPSSVRFSDFSLKNSTRTAHRSRFSVFTGTRANDEASSTAPTPTTTAK